MDAVYRRSSPRASALLDRLDDASGLPIARAMAEGPLEVLTDTRFAQPAVVATSLAALEILRERLGDALMPAYCAGHSVGELSALVAAGALNAAEALRLVAVRSALTLASHLPSVEKLIAAIAP